MSKADIINQIAECIKDDNLDEAEKIIKSDYPFREMDVKKRSYSVKQKMDQFVRDGFIDRYSGERLVNPGILRVISEYYPLIFPYHPHWKTTETHSAYWQLTPTIDHIVPIARGGRDEDTNWATTSMLNNSVKNNWTLEELRWTLFEPGEIDEWDGLTSLFVEIVERDNKLLECNYIKQWYSVSKITGKQK